MPSAGLKFSETMSGPFALGETEPKAGSDKGRAERQTLAIHADVSIDDIDRFIADREHAGELSGTIDFPPYGTGISSHSGIFNLFSPGDAPSTRYMVYELGFAHEEKNYYLAGHKIVRNDQGLDLLSDTTTLYTLLHEGNDGSGPVIGAGILTLGARDLVSLVSTIRTIGTTSAGQKAEVIAKFGKFFLSELWERYGTGTS